MNVQEVIDELLKVEDKTRKVRVYVQCGGIRGHVDASGIDPNDEQSNVYQHVYIDAIEETDDA